ncbi:hypothetical protein L4D20_14195 [Vibrio kyushuensis]|uniref:hypothetical protein n=1 Tax=Vibrio TaxID=662 RepID=UPI003D11E9BA
MTRTVCSRVSEDIFLNQRCYKIFDEGEGIAVLYLHHNHAQQNYIVDAIIAVASEHTRVICLDVSDVWSTNINELSSMQLRQLTDDIHLLVDIYWLEDVIIEGNYMNTRLKHQLLKVLKSRCNDRTALVND